MAKTGSKIIIILFILVRNILHLYGLSDREKEREER